MSVSGASAGKYVSAIAVGAGGVISVTYNGAQANAKLKAAGANVLTFLPGTNTNNDVVWVCGTAPIPAGVTVVGAAATTISAAYLPTSCHT